MVRQLWILRMTKPPLLLLQPTISPIQLSQTKQIVIGVHVMLYSRYKRCITLQQVTTLLLETSECKFTSNVTRDEFSKGGTEILFTFGNKTQIIYMKQQQF